MIHSSSLWSCFAFSIRSSVLLREYQPWLCFADYAANLACSLIQLSTLSASHRMGERALPSFTGRGNLPLRDQSQIVRGVTPSHAATSSSVTKLGNEQTSVGQYRQR
jgi:hypothetical protein